MATTTTNNRRTVTVQQPVNQSNDWLSYEETLTIEQFKAAQKVDRIDIKQNLKTGKFFFVFGGSTGAVSSKIVDPSEDIVAPLILS